MFWDLQLPKLLFNITVKAFIFSSDFGWYVDKGAILFPKLLKRLFQKQFTKMQSLSSIMARRRQRCLWAIRINRFAVFEPSRMVLKRVVRSYFKSRSTTAFVLRLSFFVNKKYFLRVTVVCYQQSLEDFIGYWMVCDYSPLSVDKY